MVLCRKPGIGHEVGVEDGDVLALRGPEPVLQGARLEAGPVHPVDVDDVEPFLPQPIHPGAGDGPGLVGRVVEHLDLQEVARVVHLGHRPDEAVGDVELVEDGQLDGDPRQLTEPAQRRLKLVAMLAEQVGHRVPVHAEHREGEEQDGVADEDRKLEMGHGS